MSDKGEEKPKGGLFKRVFGWGDSAPAPAPTPEPPPAPEAPPAPETHAAQETTAAPLLKRMFGWGEAAPAPEASPATEAPRTPKTPLSSEAPELVEPPVKKSWLSRLTAGLSRSSSAIGRGIVDIFTKRKLDAASLDDLEDILIQADLGVGAATRIREAVGKGRYEKGIDPDEVKALLAAEVERTLAPVARPLVVDAATRPFVILVIGVNGSGKTTTIGKLAAKFVGEGRKVMVAAGDTFRAAAIEQLRIWAGRAGAAIVAREQGADAAGLAFDAVTRARAEGIDVLLMDTAGRLQNRAELMSELEKIIRVMKKVDSQAPHATLLVLDATVGQNALSQVEIFGRMAGVTGLVMTKLDGTARGGILVAIADKFKLPVHFIGVGEGVEDLEPFAAKDFGRAIAGIEEGE
ncbi:MAG TPA: signal recognition particle-docking protein FtsY [Roseiarcus sp.]